AGGLRRPPRRPGGGAAPGGGPAAETATPPEAAAAVGIPEVDAVMPPPAGAAVSTEIPSGLAPDEDTESRDRLSSLRPVDEPPEELVPRIRDRGRLVVGLDQGSNLFSFRDPATGQLTGFDVDLSRQRPRAI